MATYVDGSHNMLFKLDPTKWEADLKKADQADICGHQEAGGKARATLRDHCAATNRGRYHPTGSTLAISWKKDVFSAIPHERGQIKVHEKHPTAKYNPARDIVWIGLKHIASGNKLLRINIHPVAGATKDEDVTEWGDALDSWKNWGLAQYYLDLLAFTAEQMSREIWQVIALGGDYNAALANEGAWYYPGRMLPALYRDDPREIGLDHLQVTHGSDSKDGRRWMVNINSDHNLHLIRRTFVKVPDFPGVR